MLNDACCLPVQIIILGAIEPNEPNPISPGPFEPNRVRVRTGRTAPGWRSYRFEPNRVGVRTGSNPAQIEPDLNQVARTKSNWENIRYARRIYDQKRHPRFATLFGMPWHARNLATQKSPQLSAMYVDL